MIDINEIESMKQWTNVYKVRMFWDLVAEVKRLREGIMFFLEIDKQPSRAELLELIE